MAKGKKRGAAKKPTPYSLDDELQMEATRKAGEALQPIMASFIEKNFNRQIASLSQTDLEWLAVAAICGWIRCRAEQAKTYGDDVAALIKKIEI